MKRQKSEKLKRNLEFFIMSNNVDYKTFIDRVLDEDLDNLNLDPVVGKNCSLSDKRMLIIAHLAKELSTKVDFFKF